MEEKLHFETWVWKQCPKVFHIELEGKAKLVSGNAYITANFYP